MIYAVAERVAGACVESMKQKAKQTWTSSESRSINIDVIYWRINNKHSKAYIYLLRILNDSHITVCFFSEKAWTNRGWNSILLPFAFTFSKNWPNFSNFLWSRSLSNCNFWIKRFAIVATMLWPVRRNCNNDTKAKLVQFNFVISYTHQLEGQTKCPPYSKGMMMYPSKISVSFLFMLFEVDNLFSLLHTLSYNRQMATCTPQLVRVNFLGLGAFFWKMRG